MEKKIENENNFYDACFKAWELYQNNDGKVTDEEILEIAKEFDVDADELLEEAKYEQRLTNATTKVLDAIDAIAVEFEVNPKDLETGIEAYWECYRKNLESALNKSIELITDKKDEITRDEIQEIADEFDVDVDELVEEINDAFESVEQELENDE